jgi:hypothetical protein
VDAATHALAYLAVIIEDGHNPILFAHCYGSTHHDLSVLLFDVRMTPKPITRNCLGFGLCRTSENSLFQRDFLSAWNAAS